MSLNSTPTANRVHIGIFGRRNVGKSSLINAITGQEAALVSDVAGTTTDPVSKTMELLPIGPVVFIDTPGLDDDGKLGGERVRRSLQVLEKIDIALLVVDIETELGDIEHELINKFDKRKISYLIVYNKADNIGANNMPQTNTDPNINPNPNTDSNPNINPNPNAIRVSAMTGENIHQLRERIANMRTVVNSPPIVSDLLCKNDIVVLVTPVDSAAPKGRLILPQQQVIREILDTGAQAFVTKEDGLSHALTSLSVSPGLVITDSQVFKQVSQVTPRDIPLTSFSILFARQKGLLASATESVAALETIKDGDCILISEGCTHHRQCEDIGTVKLPKWISAYTERNLRFEFTGGNSFPEDLSPYALIVHCGGCMLNDRAMRYRLASASEQNIPITNYGILIAHMNGILERCIEMF